MKQYRAGGLAPANFLLKNIKKFQFSNAFLTFMCYNTKYNSKILPFLAFRGVIF